MFCTMIQDSETSLRFPYGWYLHKRWSRIGSLLHVSEGCARLSISVAHLLYSLKSQLNDIGRTIGSSHQVLQDSGTEVLMDS